MARRDPTSHFSPCLEGAGAPPAGPLPVDTARLRKVALRITRDAAAADDAVQSALEKALRHRAEFRGEAQLSTWLHRIVVNEALGWLRSETRRARHTLAAHDAAQLVGRSGGQPLDELLLRERRERVLRGLAGLRSDERELLARFALDGSYAGFAHGARIAPSAAKTRAFRARRALRAALGESDG